MHGQNTTYPEGSTFRAQTAVKMKEIPRLNLIDPQQTWWDTKAVTPVYSSGHKIRLTDKEPQPSCKRHCLKSNGTIAQTPENHQKVTEITKTEIHWQNFYSLYVLTKVDAFRGFSNFYNF